MVRGSDPLIRGKGSVGFVSAGVNLWPQRSVGTDMGKFNVPVEMQQAEAGLPFLVSVRAMASKQDSVTFLDDVFTQNSYSSEDNRYLLSLRL